MLLRVNDTIINVDEVTFAKWHDANEHRGAKLVLFLRYMRCAPVTVSGPLAFGVMTALADACTHQFGTDVSLLNPDMWPESTQDFIEHHQSEKKDD